MPTISRILVAFSLGLALASPALAETITVPAGRPSRIGGMALYDKLTCGYLAKPKVTISTPPSHGSVRVEWTKMRMTKTRSPDTCRGKIVQGMALIYTPHAGYRGSDFVKIGLRSVYHGTASFYHAFKFDIAVK